MRPDITKTYITQMTAEFSTKYLIILFMNEMTVLQFETQAGVTIPDFPNIMSTGSVMAAHMGKMLTMKWTLETAPNPFGLELKVVIFDTEQPAATIIGSNGKALVDGSDKIHHFPCNAENSEQLAEDIATFFIQRLRGEDDEAGKS